jgi:hypothetical protein
MWVIEYEVATTGPAEYEWARWKPNAYSMGRALRHGMHVQIEEYLSHYRLRNLNTGATIELWLLLKTEIHNFRAKEIHAL